MNPVVVTIAKPVAQSQENAIPVWPRITLLPTKLVSCVRSSIVTYARLRRFAALAKPIIRVLTVGSSVD